VANPNRTNQPEIEKSEQTVLNQSFDREFNVLAVEALVYNPATGAMDRMTQPSALTSTPTQSSVSVTNASTTILAANTARRGATLFNEGAAICYMKLGATASTSSYTLQIVSGGYYELPFGYTGIITGITSSGTAQLRITELA